MRNMVIIKGISNIHSNNTLRYDNLDEFFNFLLSLDKKDYFFRRTNEIEYVMSLPNVSGVCNKLK